jgi:hypothetical protein
MSIRRRMRDWPGRPNCRGEVMIQKLRIIILPKHKRRTYMLERLSVRERPLRHAPRHGRKKVLSFVPFLNLRSNGFKGSYGCICYLVFNAVPDDVFDIDTLDRFAKPMCELHPKPQGEDPECYCGDTCKMEVSGDYKTLWQRFWMCNNLAYDPELGDT